MNLYACVGNDPLNMTDPSGEQMKDYAGRLSGRTLDDSVEGLGGFLENSSQPAGVEFGIQMTSPASIDRAVGDTLNIVASPGSMV